MRTTNLTSIDPFLSVKSHNEQSPHGVYLDRLIRPTATQQSSIVSTPGWHSNLVVDQGRRLLAALMKGESNARGINRLAIGQGSESWDTQPAPVPQLSDLELVDSNEIVIELAPDSIVFLDDQNEPSQEPSSRIQVTVNLTEEVLPQDGEETYPLREFALFGDIGNSSYMVDYVRHPVIHKRAEDTLERTIRLEF